MRLWYVLRYYYVRRWTPFPLCTYVERGPPTLGLRYDDLLSKHIESQGLHGSVFAPQIWAAP
jgi:hypothetical protein